MIATIRELIHHKLLLYMFTWREIKIKYKQSVMGMLWAILMPLVIVFAGVLVRFAFATVSGKPLAMSDLTSVAVKAAPWAFFVSSLRFGTNSLSANEDLVTKIYMPRLVFPLASVSSQLVDFLVATVVVSVFLAATGVGASVHLLWLPILVVSLILLATALTIIFSAANLFFKDVRFIVEVLLTFAIFFTPVFYDSSLFGPWAPLLLVNPVYPLLEGISTTVILHRAPALPWVAYSIVFTVVLSAVALTMFKRLEPRFAENI
jgi:ABC-type polysaccharide/polyol phosphate export permease